jgi:chromosome partitioning protein
MSFLTESLRTFLAPAPDLGRGLHEARVISVTTRKGGVGKTTVSLNLAATLAREFHRKVLLVDVDPQGHARKSCWGLTAGGSPANLSQLLLDRKRELIEAAAPTAMDDLYLVSADEGLNEAENLLSTRIGKEFILRNTLRLTRTHFDYIVLDTPPNLGNLTLNALVAADYCLLPLDLSALALQGAEDIMEALDTIDERLGHHVDLLGVVINRYDKRLTRVNDAILARLRERFGAAVIERFIPSSSAVARAQMAGRPLLEFEPDAPVTCAFHDLARDVLDRVGDTVSRT